MKITIEYENKVDAVTAIQGKDWQDAMLDFSNELKQLSKHGFDNEGRELTESEIETYHKCRKMLHGWMEVYDLTFDLRFDL